MGGGSGTHLGPVKSLSNLLAAVLRDCAVECHTDPLPDIRKMSERIEEEGLGFLALTLPTLAEALERGLESGSFDLTGVTSFASRAGLPLMLGGFLRQIFDSKGRVLDAPSVAAISSIRQICLMWKKIQLPCSTERRSAAIEAYVQADQEIPEHEDFVRDNAVLYKAFEFVSRVLWTEILGPLDSISEARNSIPKHGPGTTAERVRGNTKYLLPTWHERLEDYFPFDQFGVLNPNWLRGEPSVDVTYRSPGDEEPVRVILVPKTLKGPRVIAAEPVCMQYAQQALLHPLVAALETHHLTSGHIGFSDQTVNQKLALANSKSRVLATLDLKEASDRVPLWGIEKMFEGVPSFRAALLSCRSSRSKLPDGRILDLRKFASMGSATCFPVEAMFFYTVILAGLLVHRSRPWRRSEIAKLIRSVYVYGDDILVPVGQVEAVVDSLQAFGLKVNTRKSFWTGKFRESCGMDAFDGERVTPVYVRRACPTTAQDAQSVISWVSLGNQLYFAGLWGAADYVRRVVEDILGPLPSVHREAGCLGWHSVRDTMSVDGWDRSLQKPMVRSYRTRTVWRDDQISEHAALMKCLLPSPSPSEGRLEHLFPKERDGRHLERTARSVVLSTKRRWVPAY